jgi:hypothetical protein
MAMGPTGFKMKNDYWRRPAAFYLKPQGELLRAAAETQRRIRESPSYQTLLPCDKFVKI